MSKALEVNNQTFEPVVLNSDIPVLVDFWAPWCGPCKMMAPILDQVAGELSGRVTIAKVDVEKPENQMLAVDYHIHGIPNLKLFKNGEVIHEIVGFRPKAELLEEIDAALGE